jgi:hypothetical protein
LLHKKNHLIVKETNKRDIEMKLLTIIGIAATTIASSNAATVNVSGGFGVGVLVSTTGVNTASVLDVGGFSGGIFTAFVTTSPIVNLAAGAKIAGSFAGVSPTSLNNAPAFLRVTTPQGFAILSTSGSFPADVTSGILSSSITFSSSASGNIVSFGGADVTGVTFATPNQLNFAVVPEPSAMLLGAIGSLGLLRRRRI